MARENLHIVTAYMTKAKETNPQRGADAKAPSHTADPAHTVSKFGREVIEMGNDGLAASTRGGHMSREEAKAFQLKSRNR